jgi:predicted nucleic acid-binding protein
LTAVIADTGPLVAFLNARDRHHAWARSELARLKPPIFTCEAVISEAAFLVQRLPGGPSAVLELVARKLVSVKPLLPAEAEEVLRLMQRYKNVPMSFADACLVRLSEMLPQPAIFTLDGDFSIYRRNGRQAIPLITPRRRGR